MAVEIDRLIVTGRFGAPEDDDKIDLREALARLRREVMRDVRQMLEDAERRSRER